MRYEAPNFKQVCLIIALAIVVWIPGTAIIFMEVSGVLHFSDRQMAALGAVNMVLGVGTLIVAYRRWISKIKG